MLARKSFLPLPSGKLLETPLIIPSVSSKGAGRGGPDERPGSFDQVDAFEATLPALRHPVGLLVSSYDLHYGFIPQERFRDSTTALPVDLLLVDSGSYETLPFEGDPPSCRTNGLARGTSGCSSRLLPTCRRPWTLRLSASTNVKRTSHRSKPPKNSSGGRPGVVSDILLKPPPGVDSEMSRPTTILGRSPLSRGCSMRSPSSVSPRKNSGQHRSVDL